MAKAYRPIQIPSGVDVKAQADTVSVKGKLGVLVMPVRTGITVKIASGAFTVEAGADVERAHVGTLRAHIANAITGVTTGYVKVLEVRGMGYRVQKTKDGVQIECGYSHPVIVAAPAGVAFEVAQRRPPMMSRFRCP